VGISQIFCLFARLKNVTSTTCRAGLSLFFSEFLYFACAAPAFWSLVHTSDERPTLDRVRAALVFFSPEQAEPGAMLKPSVRSPILGQQPRARPTVWAAESGDDESGIARPVAAPVRNAVVSISYSTMKP
jgi:hypothetical protein